MKKHSILWWIFVGWWYYFFIWWWLAPIKYLMKKQYIKNTEFYGVGTDYYTSNIESLLNVTKEWQYNSSKRDIMYKYYPIFEGLKLTLESDPTNRHDPDAIKITFGNDTLAYIASDETDAIRNTVKLPKVVDAQIYGGPKKIYDPNKGKYYLSEYNNFTIKIIL